MMNNKFGRKNEESASVTSLESLPSSTTRIGPHYRRSTLAGPMSVNLMKPSARQNNQGHPDKSSGNVSTEKKSLAQASQPKDKEQFHGQITLTNKIQISSDILCLKYTQNFELLTVGCTDGVVRLYKPGSPNCVLELVDITEELSPVTRIKHRMHDSLPATTITCTHVDGVVRSWDWKSGINTFTITEKRQILGLAYHQHLPKFITLGDDGKIVLYDEETTTQEGVYQSSGNSDVVDGHKSRVFGACFHPKSPHEFITGGWDDTVQFWDMRQPHAIRNIYGVHMCGDGLDIDKTGNEILSCSWQKNQPLQLWDYGTGKLLRTIESEPYFTSLYCGKWINTDIIAAGGSNQNLLRVANTRTMSLLGLVRGLPGGVYSIDPGPVVKKSKGIPRLAFCAGKKVYEIEPSKS